MIKQNFKSQRYELKQFKGEHIEVAFAGNMNADRTIVFIHGAMMTYRIMLLFEPYFRENNLIFVNCPSRGESSNIVREQHTLDDYSERINDVLSQVIETYGIKNLIIIGYSMGGMIGTRLLKFNTLPISHLVYLNSAARITPNQSMLSRLFTSNSKRDHFKDEMIAFKNLPQYILKKSFHNKNNSIRNLFSYIAPIKTIITDIIYSTNADYLPDIEEIEQFPKLLFISGEDDEIIPYTDSQETMKMYKKYGGEVNEVIYSGIGHIDFPAVLDNLPNGTIGVIDHIKQWIQEE